MVKLVDMIIYHRLHCFGYKYVKADLFETTHGLWELNKGIIDFDNTEFQALYYFIINLKIHLRDKELPVRGNKFVMYFDRNVYNIKETEAFVSSRWSISHQANEI